MKKHQIPFIHKYTKMRKENFDIKHYPLILSVAVFLFFAPMKIKAAEISINQFGNLTLSGSIENGDYLKIVDLVRENRLDKHSIIELSSSGGSLMESLRIGHYVSLMSMSTLTFTKCESACVLILFSGKRYGASSNAVISLHKPYIDTIDGRVVDKIGSDTWWRIYGLLLSSLKNDDLAKSILGFMYSTENYDVYNIESNQYKLFGIISN